MQTELAVLQQQVQELTTQVQNNKLNRLEDSLFSKELAPHYMQLASKLATSAMVPKAYQGKPQDLFIAMAMGYQLGLSVEQAIQAIAVINGRPCLWGDDLVALCMAHPDFVDIIDEQITDANHNVIGYKCTVKRRNMADHSQIFTLEMAKKAGLLGKQGPWTQYTDRMLFVRARTFAVRNRFPDALKGIKSREEVEDYIDAEYKVVDNNANSRTELLKKDYLTKKGIAHDEVTDETNSMDASIPNNSPAQQAVSDEQPETMGEIGNKEIETTVSNLSDDLELIKKLIDEKQFSDERLEKALIYYEANTIKDLSQEAAIHFINILNKE